MENFNYYKKNIATVTILFLILFSWAGNLDKYSDTYTGEAIIEAGAAYATARGINAIVSVLQSTTLSGSIGFGGSMSIGEVLDPINDLIERFSQVMTFALSSLVLQKILLVIAANKLFSGLLTLFGALSILIIRKRKSETFLLIFKLFILLVVVRFSLGIAVLSNSAVDHMFLSSQIKEKSSKLNEFQTNVNKIQQVSTISETKLSDIQAIIHDNNLRLKNLRKVELPKLIEELTEINKKLTEANSELDQTKESLGWPVRLNPLADKQTLKQATAAVSIFEAEREATKSQISEKRSLVQELIADIQLREKQLAGDSEGLIAKFKSIKHNLSFTSIKTKVSLVADDILELLVLFILKTILIPLMFFYLFIGLARGAWRMNWEQLID